MFNFFYRDFHTFPSHERPQKCESDRSAEQHVNTEISHQKPNLESSSWLSKKFFKALVINPSAALVKTLTKKAHLKQKPFNTLHGTNREREKTKPARI